MRGTVATFDDPRGLGTIDADGTTFSFHCTAIADGSRTIEVGTEVTFELRPANLGRWEATNIAPAGSLG